MSQLPEIIKKALSQNGVNSDNIEISNENFPIKLAELANKISVSSKNTLFIGDIKIDLIKKSASSSDKAVGLTEKEIELISFLNSKSIEVDKEEILQEVWGYSTDTNTRTVETHLHRLNAKFHEAFSKKPITVKNSKYQLIET